jgi:hypothetical protein
MPLTLTRSHKHIASLDLPLLTWCLVWVDLHMLNLTTPEAHLLLRAHPVYTRDLIGS